MHLFRAQKEMVAQTRTGIHEGVGNIFARQVLQGADSEMGILFLHDNLMEPGASIGNHPHTDSEEIYFVLEGHGTYYLDGEPKSMGPGDVALIKPGHSHGLVNSGSTRLRLLVLAVRK